MNLKNALQKLSDEASKEKLKNEFSETELKSAVEDFCRTIKEDHKTLYAVIMNSAIALRDNFVVEFEVGGEIQKADIDAKRKEVIDFLSKTLKNDFINVVSVVVRKEGTSQKKNLPEEFFDSLKEINSDIEYFRDVLRLNIEL